MLVGYNTNVPYKGKLYHVQTEDNGLRNPVIITLLYFKGTILASKKINYAHLANSPDYKEKIRELMKEQHKAVIKDLVRGKYTGDGTDSGAAIPSKGVEEQEIQEPEQSQDHDVEPRIAGSLDDVLLDFIIRKEAEKDT